jgi:hypothetical protein
MGEKIISRVSKKVLKQLQDNIIEHVYKSHPGNKVYFDGSRKPTMEFFNAWKWAELEKTVTGVCRELFYSWQDMGVNEGGYKHSSVSANWPIDTRMQLADYLNVDGYDSSLWISVKREPYFNITIKELFEDGLLDKWFDQEAKKIGFTKI